MPTALDVNPVFETWKSSTGQAKESALQTLIERLEKFATSICWQRLPDHKDEFGPLVNEIVWRAVRGLEKFKGGSQLSTWVYRIAVNECNRFLRIHKRRMEVDLKEEILARPSGVDARLDFELLMSQLEGEDRILFQLVAEQREFNDIAWALDITRNAAIVRWSRLKEKLSHAI